MSSTILVLAEHKEGQIAGITLQLLGKARELADQSGDKVAALVVGHRIDGLADTLAQMGADQVVLLDSPNLEQYHAAAFGQVLSNAVKETEPSLVLLGHDYFGIELAPFVAEKLGAPLVTNCLDVAQSPAAVTVTRPMYGGTRHVTMDVRGRQIVASFPTGAIPMRPLQPRSATVLRREPILDETALPSRVVNVFRKATGGVDLTKADVIVSVGRGIGDRANLKLIFDLAQAMNGAVACSRPLADLGWLSFDHLVGLSGKEVRPKVYLACGISGASQHLAGMKEAQTIIAVNKDPSAPIFDVAHYGIVGDLFQVLPPLIEEAKKNPGPASGMP